MASLFFQNPANGGKGKMDTLAMTYGKAVKLYPVWKSR
jgi:hypothetical protein